MYNTALRGSAQWDKQVENAAKVRRTDRAYASAPPDAFDGRAAWQGYLPPVPDGCDCGASWAFAPTWALNARIRIWTDNQARNRAGDVLVLEPGKVVACHWGSVQEYEVLRKAVEERTLYEFAQAEVYKETKEVGCSGTETLLGGWQYLFRFGAFAQPCVGARDFDVCGTVRDCAEVLTTEYSFCADGSPALVHRASGFYTLPPDEAVIKQELWQWGPLTTALRVYPDFMAWDGRGVYKWDGQGDSVGGLAVALVGWGRERGAPYWLAVNWAPQWGEGGYFKIARGGNEVGVEGNVMAGAPDLPLAQASATYTSMASEPDLFLRSVWEVHPTGFKRPAIEHFLLRGYDITANQPDLYNEAMVPQYSTMTAGRPHDIVFPYRARVWRFQPDIYTYVLGYIAMLAVAALLAFKP